MKTSTTINTYRTKEKRAGRAASEVVPYPTAEWKALAMPCSQSGFLGISAPLPVSKGSREGRLPSSVRLKLRVTAVGRKEDRKEGGKGAWSYSRQKQSSSETKGMKKTPQL